MISLYPCIIVERLETSDKVSVRRYISTVIIIIIIIICFLQRYPDEGLPQVVKNVFDFDAYNNEIREQVVETLHKHGIPIGASTANVQLAKE